MFETYQLEDIFTRYEKLRTEADSLYNHIHAQFPSEVTCHKACSSCCYALFDLSLVEAMYIHSKFFATFPIGPERSEILTNAGEIDRKLTVRKKEYYTALKKGMPADDLMAIVATDRIPCPLLDKNDLCQIYDFRPITCRTYGVPTAIQGQGHVCGLNKFAKGQNYPTIFLDKIQDRLNDLSLEIQTKVNSKYKELHKTYVPMSMLLHNKYDDLYLGKQQQA